MPNMVDTESLDWFELGCFVSEVALSEGFPPMPPAGRNGILSLRFTPTDNLYYIRLGEYNTGWLRHKSI
jgi:hypothetical protein